MNPGCSLHLCLWFRMLKQNFFGNLKSSKMPGSWVFTCSLNSGLTVSYLQMIHTPIFMWLSNYLWYPIFEKKYNSVHPIYAFCMFFSCVMIYTGAHWIHTTDFEQKKLHYWKTHTNQSLVIWRNSIFCKVNLFLKVPKTWCYVKNFIADYKPWQH